MNTKKIIFHIFITLFVLAFTIPFITNAAWTAPSANPPGNNAEIPINVSATTQTKSGALIAGSIVSNGGGSIYGSLSVGGIYAPSYTLDVSGSALIRGWLRTTGNNGWYSETYGGGWYMSDTTWIRAYNNKNVYTPGEMQATTIRGNSYVCIGGDCRTSWPASGSDNLDTFISRGGSTSRSITFTGGNEINFGGGGEKIYSERSGSYPLNLCANGTCAYVNSGALYASAFYYTSDRKLKKNIKSLESSLEKILSLKPVRFDWKDDTGINKDGDKIGFIAQDVEEVFPESVVTGSNDTKLIDYNSLIPVLVKSIQEQQKQIDSLKTEVEALKLEK